MMGPKPALLYRLIYNEGGSSFAWWDGSGWSPDGEVHSVSELHTMLERMGAIRAMSHGTNGGNVVYEIWTLGG